MKMNSCFKIQLSESAELLINIDGEYVHEDYVKKTLRIHGHKRKEQTNVLMIEGVTNTLSSNIIVNAKTKTKKGGAFF